MSDILSARHQLPFLAVGQAQKEITHNEALLRIDALLHMSIISELSAPPMVDIAADAGKSWLVGANATGIWAGKDGNIAHWQGGSWRYIVPAERMRVWNVASNVEIIFVDGQWEVGDMVPNPSGGSVIDMEARTAIASILDILRSKGTILA